MAHESDPTGGMGPPPKVNKTTTGSTGFGFGSGSGTDTRNRNGSGRTERPTIRRESGRYPSLSVPLEPIVEDEATQDPTQQTLGRSQFDTELDDEAPEFLGASTALPRSNTSKDDRNILETEHTRRDKQRRNSIIQLCPDVATTELSLRFDPDTNDASLWFCHVDVNDLDEEGEPREELIEDIRDDTALVRAIKEVPRAIL